MSSPTIRAITFGLNLNALNPESSVKELLQSIASAKKLLELHRLSARCIRVTCQPMDELFDAGLTGEQLIAFAQKMENLLGPDVWFCLPGPQNLQAEASVGLLEFIPELLAKTNNVFTNTMIGNEQGIHRKAIRQVASLIKRLAQIDESKNANFRFAAMANVAANTPFFPAAYHQGKAGFSVALELAAIMNHCFSEPGDVNRKLKLFEQSAGEIVYPVSEFSKELAQLTNSEFKGMDFSLAPYPGSGTSAVQAVELLNNTRFGDFDFLMSLYSVNNVLKTGFSDIPMVGYNGTMFSILEDSRLAKHCADRRVDVKDLLLYANVCGCGLDMVPLDAETTTKQLASLIESIATCANKWSKPLIARLLPCAVDGNGLSRFQHDFIENTAPIRLQADCFSELHDDHSYYQKPARKPPLVVNIKEQNDLVTDI
jgi:uncharacterized protein (UPF0210 family)